MVSLENETLEELQRRKTVALVCIKVLETVEDSDPRKVEALKTYNEQLQKIEEAIKIVSSKPHDVIVGVKSATISPHTS